MATLRGESLLAVLGVTAALRPGPLRVTQEVMMKQEGLPRGIQRRVRRFIRGKGFADYVAPPPFDYNEIAGLMPNAKQEARLVENFSRIQDPAIALELADALGAAIGYLETVAPFADSSLPALVGRKRIEPPSIDVADFRRVYSVCDRALVVVDDLAAGVLVPDQVEAYERVFPELYKMTRQFVLEEMIAAGDGRPDWALPYAKDEVLQIFLQTDTVDTRLHGELQKTFETAREKESKGGKSASTPTHAGSHGSRDLNDSSTSSQRLEAK